MSQWIEVFNNILDGDSHSLYSSILTYPIIYLSLISSFVMVQ